MATLSANWSSIPSPISPLSSVCDGGGIQSLPCDGRNGGFLPCYISAYISSIISDNVIQARYNLNSTTWDGIVHLTQNISPKRSKHISEMNLVRYRGDLTANNHSCRSSSLHIPRCPRSGHFLRNCYSISSSFTYRTKMVFPKPCSSFAVIGTTPHFIFPLCGPLFAFRKTHPHNPNWLSRFSRRDAVAHIQPPFTSTSSQ
jgi:hypothetical protein